jgi:hypothetical protein
MDPIGRGQQQPGTCGGGDCDDDVRWEPRIHRQWHCALLHRASERLGEARTVGQHDQYPIGGAHVELSQRGRDCGRLVGQRDNSLEVFLPLRRNFLRRGRFVKCETSTA